MASKKNGLPLPVFLFILSDYHSNPYYLPVAATSPKPLESIIESCDSTIE